MAAEGSEARFYLSLEGETHGPYAREEIDAWIEEGRIAPSALVHDGFSWRPAADLGRSPPEANPPLRPGRPARSSEIEREAVARAFTHAPLAAEPVRIRGAFRAVGLIVSLVGACLGLYFASFALRSARGAKEMAELHQMKTSLVAALAQEGPPIGPDGDVVVLDRAETPRPLPEDLAKRYREMGVKNPWRHPLEYVSDGAGMRLVAPIGRNRDRGWLVADPFSVAVWYLPPDSGPVTWAGVSAVPEDAAL